MGRLDNYEALMDTWEEALHIVRDTEMKARIDGIVSQMQKFDFTFGTHFTSFRQPQSNHSS